MLSLARHPEPVLRGTPRKRQSRCQWLFARASQVEKQLNYRAGDRRSVDLQQLTYRLPAVASTATATAATAATAAILTRTSLVYIEATTAHIFLVKRLDRLVGTI